MEIKRGVHYRLTSDILCVGVESCSGGLFYLKAGSEIEVVDPDSRPFIEVLHPEGNGRLFSQDLVARAVVIHEPIVRSAAA